MMDLVARAEDAWKYVWEHQDKRTEGLPLVGNPMPMILVTLGYLGMVVAGPRIMRDFKPFDLRSTMIAYNIGMVLYNVFLVHEFIVCYYKRGFNFFCQSYIADSYLPEDYRLARAIYMYYLCKVGEFVDTLFFVVRKRGRQLTFLHVYHHSSIFIIMYLCATWFASAPAPSGIGINATVHIFMYSYYTLTSFGPRFSKYFWLKPYITLIQLVQFYIVMMLSLNSLRYDRKSCDIPMIVKLGCSAYMVTMIALFGRFYIFSYWVDKNELPSSMREEKTTDRGYFFYTLDDFRSEVRIAIREISKRIGRILTWLYRNFRLVSMINSRRKFYWVGFTTLFIIGTVLNVFSLRHRKAAAIH